jgi:hypothetical protein
MIGQWDMVGDVSKGPYKNKCESSVGYGLKKDLFKYCEMTN